MAATATELLAKLADLGAVLEPRADRLKVRFPEDRRPEVEKLRPELARLKPELLRALVERTQNVQARIRGWPKVRAVPAAEVEPCWHCVRPGKERGRCGCALCGHRGPGLRWEAGECGACHGTGRLAWAKTVQ